ncbi:carboxymuconolactone decarboxylase family protein [Lacipirellula parvula]|uniref:4-carboxymuconolactone decarboxylase domain/alkylhydroperoxidase AhpD family core domain protein n=1 Tax=Lacipirellula parvula TaxID=2650471 RepID=A0A5K7XF72_9BACT|nr:carboxymuconolactone decarboxylase family protein [Lacipirellula parvula]BBO35450.1 4-carboxymuconolactone decarboxylase domain/alkylhydroperoxidase AhpD family core domain protein [Lacipirellula parvula]
MSKRLDYARVAPEAVKALAATRPYIQSTAISPRLRALVELRTSQINGCAYCVDMHSREARAAGEVQQRLDCLPVWRETDLYDDRERAALAWAESVTLVSQTGVPDEAFAEVRRHFEEKDVVDLTLIIGAMNAWNRLAISFRQGPPKRAE